MNRNRSARLRPHLLNIVILLVCIGVFASLSRYFLPEDLYLQVGNAFYGPEYVEKQFDRYQALPLLTFVHVVPGSLFLLIGPLQLSRYIRGRWIRLHRVLGRICIVCGVIAALSSFVVAVRVPFAGVSEIVSAFLFAPIMLFSLHKAYSHARRKEIPQHREWMIRSLAIGLGVAAIRVYAFGFFFYTDVPHYEAFATSFWLGFVGNLLVAEIWINYTRPSRVLG